MRILQVVHGFPPRNAAGTEIYTYNLSRELSKNNEVTVFCRASDLKKREYELTFHSSDGLDIFTVNNTFRHCDSFEKFYKNDVISARFAELLDRVKPDIVHIQHLIFLSTTIIEEAKKRGIPVVFTLHDYWLICPQWHFLNRDLDICGNNDISRCIDCLDYQLSIKKIPKRIYTRIRGFTPVFLMDLLRRLYVNMAGVDSNSSRALHKIESRRRHIKELCSKVDLFIAPSPFLKQKLNGFGIPADKIMLLSHGVDREAFGGFKRRPSDRIRFGFIGTILPAKGVDVLIRAFNLIKDERAELTIYGKVFPYRGFEYYPGLIKKLAKNGNIRFAGGFEHKDVSGVFSEIDILVLPSIWNENCPLTILEAFSAGTPVIASRIGGIPELIKDMKNGLLFEPRDHRGLYERMAALIKEPGLIEKLRAGIEVPKDIKDNAEEIGGLYESLLSNG